MPDSKATAERIADLFAACRLLLIFGEPMPALLEMLRHRGIPAVAAPEESARLEEHAEKFDGLLVLEACPVQHLAMAAADDGLLAFVGSVAAPPDPDFVPLGTAGGLTCWRRQRRRPRPGAGGLAHFADHFVGCRHVLQLGTGAGGLLNALAVRDIDAIGITPDEAAVATAVHLGHAAERGGVERLRLRPRSFDGIALEEWGANSGSRRAESLVRHVAFALRPSGRFGLRRIEHADCLLAAFDCSPAFEPEPVVEGGMRFFRRRPGADFDLPPAADLPDLSAAVAADHAVQGWHELERAERRIKSQGGEDGVLAAIFAQIGTTNRHAVEFGCGDGSECNTAALHDEGWHCLLMDAGASPRTQQPPVQQEWITAENIDALFAKYDVPAAPDLVSIDLDGNDYWVWHALSSAARVVVIEYNGNLALPARQTMPYAPDHRWDGSDYYGASLAALVDLGARKGYRLVYCNAAGVNAFFVRADLLDPASLPPWQDLYRPANYWYRGYRSLPDFTRSMLTV